MVALKSIWDKQQLIFLEEEYGMRHLGKAVVKFSSALGRRSGCRGVCDGVFFCGGSGGVLMLL